MDRIEHVVVVTYLLIYLFSLFVVLVVLGLCVVHTISSCLISVARFSLLSPVEKYVNRRVGMVWLTICVMGAASVSSFSDQVGYKSVDDYVTSGMVVGLGTGSTAAFAGNSCCCCCCSCGCGCCRRLCRVCLHLYCPVYLHL